jgi:iron(III) transport system permease protein
VPPERSASITNRRKHRARKGALPWLALSIGVLAGLPIAAIIWIALSGNVDAWPHLFANVIPKAAWRTVLLLAAVSVTTLFTGVVAAWLTSACEFPLRRTLTVALVLPLAIPTYLAAYTFGEFFDFSGPLQTALRAVTGYKSVRDYWFPNLKTIWGAAFVMGSVLYPYIFLTARSMFLMQGRASAEVARTLGASPLRTFLKVQLPMARPAIVVGLTLVMMETLNDIGAVEYLGVKTLTFSIYETWLNRNDLAGAAQIALIMLVFVALLTLTERWARRQQRFSAQKTTAATHNVIRIPLKGVRAVAAMLICGLPPFAGFFIPAWVMGGYAIKRLDEFLSTRLLSALGNTIFVALAVALLATLAGFTLAYAKRQSGTKLARLSARMATFGYGVPGTVLAIGVLIPFAALDNQVSGAFKSMFGVATGLILSGSSFAIIFACTARFLTMAEGNIESGFQKLSPNLDWAARTLGRTSAQALRTVLVPMMRPAALTAALLVFIETTKELSATILLRPFNFNTLATLVYEDASRSKVADASVASVIIIIAGLIPVIAVSRALDRAR